MNWVVFCVLLGLVLFNLLGIGIYHYEWRKDSTNPDSWKCQQFYIWTAYMFLCGIAYCALRLIIWVKGLFKK